MGEARRRTGCSRAATKVLVEGEPDEGKPGLGSMHVGQGTPEPMEAFAWLELPNLARVPGVWVESGDVEEGKSAPWLNLLVPDRNPNGVALALHREAHPVPIVWAR